MHEALSTATRLVTAGVGLLFVGLGVAVLASRHAQGGWGSLLAALALLALGAEALLGALRNRRPWLWRIGPLP
ncbi:hypothetical protein [Frateuria defendens]|uniref:hypothetical protein n=1 Tax=Frateuria defendens TaxID=2219559 RepID=UPI00066FED21|nr:hypothetical protein [Frateuria defendens]